MEEHTETIAGAIAESRPGQSQTPGESQQTPAQSRKKKGLAGLADGEFIDNRIPLTDPNGNPLGITMEFDRFDGDTKLRYDAKIDATAGLKITKQVAAKNAALAWLFALKCNKPIEVDSTVDLEGITDLKGWFLTNSGAVIMMRTAVYEYLKRNRVDTEDAKN